MLEMELLRIIDNYERLVQYLLHEGMIRPEIGNGFSLTEYLDQIDEKLMIMALDKTEYVQRKAAKLLGIAPRMMCYKMKKYGIPAVRHVKRS